MQLVEKAKNIVINVKQDKQFANDRSKAFNMAKQFLLLLFRWVIIIGMCYIILSPLIGIISSSFFSDTDVYDKSVYIIPKDPTLDRYRLSWLRLDYLTVLLKSLWYDLSLLILQVVITSMVGYGFARFQFPFKKVLFGCVVVMIVIPTHTIMVPLYMVFRNFDPLGIVTAINGEPISLLGSTWPMYIMTLLGCGLRSGLYIYIFNQFFRGLPKEIEEAALVDGAGPWFTYFRIMLVNAIPSVITVSIFSLVWQYNDLFFANLFVINTKESISKSITTLSGTIGNLDRIVDPTILQLYTYAGVVLVILPVIIIYVALQKYFMEGVERSGIVG